MKTISNIFINTLEKMCLNKKYKFIISNIKTGHEFKEYILYDFNLNNALTLKMELI